MAVARARRQRGPGCMALLLLALALAAGAAVVFVWRGHQGYLAAAAALGFPLAPADYAAHRAPPVPEAENAALRYEAALAVFAERWTPDETIAPLLAALEGRRAATMSDAERLRITATAEAARAMLEPYEQAARLERARFHFELERPETAPDWKALVVVARLHALAARIRLHDGDLEAALASAEALFRLAAALQDAPHPDAPAAAMQLLEHGEPLSRELTARVSLRLPEQQRLDRWLRTLDLREAAARGVEARIVIDNASVERSYTRDWQRRIDDLGTGALLWYWHDRAYYLRQAIRPAQRIRAPWPTQTEPAPAVVAPARYPLSRRLLTDVGELPARAMEADARVAVLRLALAMDAHVGEHGAPPATPQALVPVFLPALPADPAAEGPLRVRVQTGTALIYSVGRNRADDGGREDDIAWLAR